MHVGMQWQSYSGIQPLSQAVNLIRAWLLGESCKMYLNILCLHCKGVQQGYAMCLQGFKEEYDPSIRCGGAAPGGAGGRVRVERRAVHHGRGGRARRDAVARHGLRGVELPRHPHGPPLGAGQVRAVLRLGVGLGLGNSCAGLACRGMLMDWLWVLDRRGRPQQMAFWCLSLRGSAQRPIRSPAQQNGSRPGSMEMGLTACSTFYRTYFGRGMRQCGHSGHVRGEGRQQRKEPAAVCGGRGAALLAEFVTIAACLVMPVLQDRSSVLVCTMVLQATKVCTYNSDIPCSNSQLCRFRGCLVTSSDCIVLYSESL